MYNYLYIKQVSQVYKPKWREPQYYGNSNKGYDIISLYGNIYRKQKRDSFSNQFTTKVEVASTINTEIVEYNGTVYKWYPKIREEDIGIDTSNVFVDTLRFSNTYLDSIGGDFDGDQ